MPEKPDTESDCPICGSDNLINESDRGELICNECGNIVEDDSESPQDRERTFDTDYNGDKSRVEAPSTGSADESTSTISDEKRSEAASTSAMERKGLTTTVDWKDKDFTEEKMTETERESEWSPWYPCPECGSTKLLERIEEVLTVTVNEEGEITKTRSDGEEQYWKCAECGEELYDSW